MRTKKREKCDKSISDQLNRALAELKGLSEKASAAEANANAAKAKDKAALEQRVDAAEAAAKADIRRSEGVCQKSKDETTKWWGQVQDNWKSHVAKVHKDVEEAKANMKADRAEKRAERAEANAAAAVEFACAAIEEAEYQVLNAALARLDAEDAEAAT